VAKGDTLSSIAVHYNVSVASLKSANGITDERKLRVGQKLVIPAKSAAKTTTAATPKAKTAAPSAKAEPSFWDKVKSDF
jgi:LysM repeat protein